MHLGAGFAEGTRPVVLRVVLDADAAIALVLPRWGSEEGFPIDKRFEVLGGHAGVERLEVMRQALRVVRVEVSSLAGLQSTMAAIARDVLEADLRGRVHICARPVVSPFVVGVPGRRGTGCASADNDRGRSKTWKGRSVAREEGSGKVLRQVTLKEGKVDAGEPVDEGDCFDIVVDDVACMNGESKTYVPHELVEPVQMGDDGPWSGEACVDVGEPEGRRVLQEGKR
eukprot:7394362-Heterocapsa_arctica.AAC.3